MLARCMFLLQLTVCKMRHFRGSQWRLPDRLAHSLRLELSNTRSKTLLRRVRIWIHQFNCGEIINRSNMREELHHCRCLDFRQEIKQIHLYRWKLDLQQSQSQRQSIIILLLSQGMHMTLKSFLLCSAPSQIYFTLPFVLGGGFLP